MKICKKCQDTFPNWVTIDGKPRNLGSRKYCLECSPFGSHNTKNLTGERKGFFWRVEREELERVIDSSDTMSQVLMRFGFSHWDNGRSLKDRCKREGIDLSALKERSREFSREQCKENGFEKKYSMEEILVENSTYGRGALKRRLIKEGFLKEECVICNRPPEWKEKPLVLIIDHINGVNNDNRLDNLRLLCPNCNSQTETFAGRNSRYCALCTNRISQKNQSGLCRSCVARSNNSDRPTKCPPKEDLIDLRAKHSREAIGRMFDVTGNAVKKWEKKYEMIP